MSMGVSLFLVAVGAVLAFALHATVSGLDLVTVGWILMIVGAVDGLLSMKFSTTWGLGVPRRDTTVIQRDRTTV
jgi:hypothetical protein